MNAIPTTYHGIRFRSRLEAEAAQLLDLVRLDWIYESESFLLDSGDHYWPDFQLPDCRLWLETRGYTSARGHAQIQAFRDTVLRREIGFAYVVLDHEKLWWTCPEEGTTEAVLLGCNYCGRWSVAPEPAYRCSRSECLAFNNRSNIWDVRILEGHLRLFGPLTPNLSPVEFARSEGLQRPIKHGFSSAGDVLKELRRGPRIGRALDQADALSRARGRPEGGRTA
jgi:hypothetical protein